MKRHPMFTDRKTYIVKKAVSPKLMYKFSVISVKTPAGFLVEIDKLILDLI